MSFPFLYVLSNVVIGGLIGSLGADLGVPFPIVLLAAVCSWMAITGLFYEGRDRTLPVFDDNTTDEDDAA